VLTWRKQASRGGRGNRRAGEAGGARHVER
jgi:hypothetical protein